MKIVIKVGGALFAQGIEKLVEDLKEVVKKHQVVIVHGGGPQITEIGTKMGKEPKYYDTPTGMKTRYTDKDQIDMVKMAIGGLVNKSIVEAMRQAGVNAFGFTGLDGGSILADRKDQIMVIDERGKRRVLRGEFSGKVDNANSEIINILLEKGYVPVIGSMCSSKTGDAVNVDGDRAAVVVAVAINADKYISLTDVVGIYKDMETKEVIPKMSEAEAELFMQKATGGMKKKIFAAIEALKSGINEFVIYSGEIDKPISSVLEENKGTIISKK